MTATEAFEVVHAGVPGRVRLRVRGLYRDPAACRTVCTLLQDLAGVAVGAANPLTGTVLLNYPRDWPLQRLLQELGQRLDGALPDAPMPPSLRRMANPVLARRADPPDPAPVQAAAVARTPWHTLPAAEVLRQFAVPLDGGLSTPEAQARLQRFGLNRLPQPQRRSSLALLLEQVSSLPVLLLAASAVLSAATGGLADAAVILGVVVINAGIGYVTESQAERVIDALTAGPRPHAQVLRDGQPTLLPAEQVVPGDLVLLTPGTQVPADARLIHVRDLRVDESALTGESLPVAKHAQALATLEVPLAERCNMVYMGTAVTGGSALAVVVGTGRDTELGVIQGLVDSARPPDTPMQRQLDQLGNQLVWASLAICAAVFVVGLARGYGVLPMLRAAVSLAVAAIPEGLPTVATTTLALGLARMRRHHVLIRRLAAVETLGSVQVICLDKTGTLTQNRMAVQAVWVDGERLSVREGRFLAADGERAPHDHTALLRLLHVAVLCNESRLNGGGGSYSLEGSATENALLALALSAGVDVQGLRTRHPVLKTQYRSEGRAWMATWHAAEAGETLLAVKGSPEQVLALCRWHQNGAELAPITPEFVDAVRMQNERMAGEALRVLAFAYWHGAGEPDTHGLVWLGLAGMADPLRPGVRELIAQFHAAGIKTVMITGDQSATAYAIGKQLDLSGSRELEILDSTRIEALDPELLAALAERVEIFSRVSPAHKLRIVQALQRAGRVVAMTGDGINDGPALKAADIGVAMGAGGTEVARSVADVVLEDDELQTMIVAVAQGRTLYANIRKSVHYLVSSNLSEIGLTFAAIALGLGQPLNTLQLLWINLVTDIFPALALSLEPPEPDVLRRPPRNPQEPIIRRQDLARYGFEAGALTLGSLAAYGYGVARYGPGAQANTVAFMSITLGQLLHALSCRSDTHGLFTRGRLPDNRWLTLALSGTALLQAGTVLLPPLRGLLGNSLPQPADWLAIAAGAGLPYLAIEAAKRNLAPNHEGAPR
ncbi:MAG: cation-transporting P-type ATPase [Thiobacillaceae bacterium]|nr:cation-transporting P-type ATPase [Thiobacillaceae bacterium]